jgi:hypothetical protein
VADSGWKAMAYFCGGVALLGLAAFGFYTATRANSNMLQLQLMCNLPVLLAIGCFSAAYLARRSPNEVVLFDDRVEIRRANDTRSLPLADLSMATLVPVVFAGRRKLKLFDRTGRCVAVVPDSIDGFDELATLLQADLQQREDDQASFVRMRKSRRQAVLLVAVGLVFAGLITTLALVDRAEARDAKLLEEQGRPTDASILRQFTAPNGITKRIEYRVTDASGRTADHNVEVQPMMWNLMAASKTVPVVAVPGRPDVARLAIGEIKSDAGLPPRFKVLLYIAGGVMCVFFFVGAVLNWRGIDIDLDSRTGKISVKRFGTGR